MDISIYISIAGLLFFGWSWACYATGVRAGRDLDADLIIKHMRDEEPAKPATQQQLSVLQMLSRQLGLPPPRKNITMTGAHMRIEELLATKQKLRELGVLRPADPDGPEGPITDKQFEYIARLVQEIGDEFDEREIGRMTRAEASVHIDELLKVRTRLRRQQRAAREQLPRWDAEGRLPSQ